MTLTPAQLIEQLAKDRQQLIEKLAADRRKLRAYIVKQQKLFNLLAERITELLNRNTSEADDADAWKRGPREDE